MSMSLAMEGATHAKSALQKRVVQMFRTMCREVPDVVKIYDLPLTVGEVRHLVGLHFRRNQGVQDPRVIEMMLSKGEMELEETRMQWKQKPHLITLLQPTMLKDGMIDLDGTEPVERDDFIQRFIDNDLGERPSVHARSSYFDQSTAVTVQE